MHRGTQAAGAGKTGGDRYSAGSAVFRGPRGEPDTATMTLLETAPCRCWRRQRPGPSGWGRRRPLPKQASCGGDVMKHLEDCPQAVLLAVTLGPGVDAQIRRAGVGDIAAGVASDALGSALASRPQTRRKQSCASGPQTRELISPGGFRPATVTGILRCSRWWPTRWIRCAGRACA